MLKQRIITALTLLPIVIWCVFFAPNVWAFRIFAAAIVVVAAWEWTAMMAWKSVPLRASYALTVFMLLLALAFLPLPALLPQFI
jgi:phosphatidate cytidylyltransferase